MSFQVNPIAINVCFFRFIATMKIVKCLFQVYGSGIVSFK